MTAATTILNAICHGDENATEQVLPLVSREIVSAMWVLLCSHPLRWRGRRRRCRRDDKRHPGIPALGPAFRSEFLVRLAEA